MDTKGNRTMSEVKAYRVKDFCKAYGVSRSFAYNEMKAGRLRFYNVGVMRLISYEAAEEWRASYENAKTHEAT
jgi:excisionase family DNA binding protein